MGNPTGSNATAGIALGKINNLADRLWKLEISPIAPLMAEATMWKGRQRYVPELVYSVSVLLLKNILEWRNVLYFVDGPLIYKTIIKNM